MPQLQLSGDSNVQYTSLTPTGLYCRVESRLRCVYTTRDDDATQLDSWVPSASAVCIGPLTCTLPLAWGWSMCRISSTVCCCWVVDGSSWFFTLARDHCSVHLETASMSWFNWNHTWLQIPLWFNRQHFDFSIFVYKCLKLPLFSYREFKIKRWKNIF